MKKYLFFSLIACLGLLSLFGFFGVLFVSDAEAATQDSGYVVVRCTISISVNVLDTYATWYVNGQAANGAGISCGQNYISGVSSISVHNDSSGAITKWYVHVDTIQVCPVGSDPKIAGNWTADDVWNGGWKLANTPDINQASLMAVFKTTATDNLGDFTVGDTNNGDSLVLRNATAGDVADTYNIAGAAIGRFAPNTDEFASRISAGNANWTRPGDVRGLGLRLDTPIAVVDQNWRRFVIVVTADTND